MSGHRGNQAVSLLPERPAMSDVLPPPYAYHPPPAAPVVPAVAAPSLLTRAMDAVLRRLLAQKAKP